MRLPLFVLPIVFAMAPQAMQPPPRPVQPPRDATRRLPPEPAGTAIIRGRVLASDTGSPIRRATVNLQLLPPTVPPAGTAGSPGAGLAATGAVSAAQPARITQLQSIMVNGAQTVTSGPSQGFGRPHSATTDAQGAFEFKDLPAGSYRVTASPGSYSAQYLSISYGGKKAIGAGSYDAGQTIQLADGQAFEKAIIALPRGSVITGRVTDEDGNALARVQVYTVLFTPGSGRGMRTGGFGQTDDLGQFRLYGLVPGDYTVVAEARGNTFVPPNAPLETEEDKIGFMTTFYPGTADEGAAQRVRVRAAAETSGIEIRMTTGRLFHISGMVTDSQGAAGTRFNGSLSQRSKFGNGSTSFGFSTDQDGHFQMRNVAPGTYRLTVRAMRQSMMGAIGGPQGQADQGEFATLTLAVNADLDNLVITTSPGVTITGQNVYDGGPPQVTSQQPPQPLRINAQYGDPADGMGGVPTPQPATVGPDLTFTMKGLMGEYLLRTGGQNLLGGAEDITDTPREFKQGEHVTLVIGSRASTVEGNLTDDKGAPVTEATLMLFSEDKSSWRMNSVRTHRAGPDQTGHFRFMGILPGRYLVIATPRERLNVPFPDSSFFEDLAKDATSLVVGEDEQRQVDLKVSGGGGGLQ